MKLQTLRVATVTALLTIVSSAVVIPAAYAQDAAGPAFSGGRHGPGMGGPRGGRGGPGRGEPEDRVANLDTNSDGKVSLEEFLAPRVDHIDEMFERRDTNGDGLIAEGEGRPERPANAPARGDRAGRPGRPAIDETALVTCVRKTIPDFDLPERPDADDIEDRFDTVDTNNDGKLSIAEVTAAVQARATAHFSKLDTNSDGFITTAEIDTQQADREAVQDAVRACAKALATG